MQSGGTNWDLYRQLYWRYGRTLPAGSCYSVGLGGHICGGGYGLLSRRFGLTVDWLTGVNVATVNANRTTSVQRATKESAAGPLQDLFWAHTGGGGGNFGLITRFEFAALPAAPQRAEIFTFSWNWADIKDPGDLERIVRGFEQLVRTMPPSFFGLLKLFHRDAGSVALVVQNTYEGPAGSTRFADRLRQAMRQARIDDCGPAQAPIGGHPVHLACPVPYEDLRWWEAVQTLNGSGPNQKGKYKSAYMRDAFPADQIRTLYNYLIMSPAGGDMSQSLLQVDSYGGAINDVAPQATAVWQRSSILKLQYQTYWQDPDERPSRKGDVQMQWIRDFYGEMYKAYGGVPDPSRDPAGNVDGCYINYPDGDLNERGGRAQALALYYGGNLPRLMRAKRQWDPLDFFQNRQSIAP